MSNTILSTAASIQQNLRSADVSSVITGDIGMSYHGVDIVIHDIEICVRQSHRTKAIEILEGLSEVCERLSDIHEPDFYHPYKHGAARFRLQKLEEPIELHLVIDSMLGMKLTSKMMKTGMSTCDAHRHLQGLCEDSDDEVVSSLVWPSLSAYEAGWLKLAHEHRTSEASMIYLMYAERLLDANDVDDLWCSKALDHPAYIAQAKQLLRGKQHRIRQSTWD